MMKNTDSFVERLIRYGSYPAILGAAAYVMLLGVGSVRHLQTLRHLMSSQNHQATQDESEAHALGWPLHVSSNLIPFGT